MPPYNEVHERFRDLRIKQFETYRKEDQHECTLLSQRTSAFLTSQSFLAVATGAVYSNLYGKTWSTPIVSFIAGFAIVLAMHASLAIRIGCFVLRRWHNFGNCLLAADKEGYLDGFHLNRDQPDGAHFWSMDVFNAGVPLVFLAGWIAVIFVLHLGYWSHLALAGLFAAWVCWTLFILCLPHVALPALRLPKWRLLNTIRFTAGSIDPHDFDLIVPPGP
jgi:hypothetical protein